MSKNYNVVTNIIAKTTDFVNGMKKASDSTNSFSQNFKNKMDSTGKKLKSVGTTMSKYLTVPLTGIGIGLIKVASDAEEMRGKFSVVFADLEQEMRDFAAESSKAWGRSQIDIEGYLAETQNMLVGMGMVREEGSELSKQIVSLGVDLASFNNLSESDALNNLTSAISGNHSASKSLGAVLNENTLAVEMERMGLQGKFQDLDEATKMEVRYQAILSQSTDAVGDAVRTSDSFANQMRRMKGQIKDVSASFGELLLPYATKVVNKVNDMINWFGNLDESKQKLILVFGALGAVIPPILIGLGFVASAIAAIGLPVAVAIAGIIGLIGILVGAYKTSETFRDTVNNALSKVKEFFLNVVSSIRQYWDEHGEAILQRAMETFFTVRDVVIDVLSNVVEFIQEKLAVLREFWNEHGAQIIQAVQNCFSFIKSVIEFVMPFVEMLILQIWGNIKGIFSGALDMILGLVRTFSALFTADFKGVWEGIKQIFSGAITFLWNAIQLGFLGRIMGVIRSFGSLALAPIRSLTTSIRTFFSNMVTNAVGRFNALRNSATSIFNNVRNAIVTPIQRARDLVKSAIDRIVGFFKNLGSKLKIDIPRPKLPKFSLKGEFSLMPPRVPTIGLEWFKDGGIFAPNSPRVIGIGDHPNAPEAALPLTDNVLGSIGASIAKLMPQPETINGMSGLFDIDRLINSVSNSIIHGFNMVIEQLDISELAPVTNNTYHLNNTYNYTVNNADKFDEKTAKKYSVFHSRQLIDHMKRMGR